MAKYQVGDEALINDIEPRLDLIEHMLQRIDHTLSSLQLQDRFGRNTNPTCSHHSANHSHHLVQTRPSLGPSNPSLEVFTAPRAVDRGTSIQKKPDQSQRHNVFRTRITVIDNVCDTTISSGSSKNLVSRRFVEALDLKMEKQASPCKIWWIKKGPKVQIVDTCKVPISIGMSYKDKVICDVVDMDVCDVLLGRPWLFDVDATYKGQDNTYSFLWKGNEILMQPLMQEEMPTDASEHEDLCTLM